MNDFTLRNIIVIVYIISIMYFYYIYTMISLSKNSKNNRCDPIIMMTGKLAGFENSATNFKTCIEDIQPEIYNEITSSYDRMNKIIEMTTSDMKESNNKFLADLKTDYERKNWDISNNIISLNNSNNSMNQKIINTNTSIKNSLDKIINL